jgi:hypothetical protein
MVPTTVQLSLLGLYFPPVSESLKKSATPPHTIISVPFQTAV